MDAADFDIDVLDAYLADYRRLRADAIEQDIQYFKAFLAEHNIGA